MIKFESMRGCHVPAMSDFEDGQAERLKFCIVCTEQLDTCKCIWAAMRELQDSYRGLFHDIAHLDEQLKAIQKAEKIDLQTAKELIYEGARTHLTILKLEAKMKEHEEIVKRITEDDMKLGKKPHKCPVCDGKVKVYIDTSKPMSGIESIFAKRDLTGMHYEDCKSCEGKGVIWG